MNAFDIRNKYCMDVSLATPTAIKIDPNMVSAVLKGVSAKKTIAIPRDFIEREAKYIMEWAEKDPSIVAKFKKASQLEKSQIMKKVVADYFAKFKWPVASRLQKAGLLDSVDLNDAVSEIKKQSFLKRCAKLGALDHQAKGFLLANGVGDLIEKLGPEGAADYICEAHEVRKRLTGKIGEYRYQVKLAPKKGPKGINGGRIVDLVMYGPNSAKVPIPGFENGSWESFRRLSKEEKNVVNTIVAKYSK